MLGIGLSDTQREKLEKAAEKPKPPAILVRRGHKLKGKMDPNSDGDDEEEMKNRARNEESVHRNVKEFSKILKRKTTAGHA